jgi:hypothetical protein
MEQCSVTQAGDSQVTSMQESNQPWPRVGLPYDSLHDTTKEMVLKHLKIAGETHRWFAIERHLQKELEQKKSISDPQSEQYHQKYLSLDRYKYSVFPPKHHGQRIGTP